MGSFVTPRARYTPTPPRVERDEDALRTRVLVMLRFENTARQIAADLGISISKVHRWRAEAGLAKHRIATRYEKQMARELRFERRWSIVAIARKLGFHRSAVSRWLKRSKKK